MNTLGPAVNSASTTSLRAAIQLALAVARQGEAQYPVRAAPARLRPYLGFAKVPRAAMEVCRRVVDDDDEFRRRVAAEASAEQVGSLGWLWLTRPEGWEETIARLLAEAERDRTERADARRADELARGREAAREAAQQAEQARRQLQGELDALRRDHLEAQRALRDSQAALAEARAEAARLDGERADLLRRLKAAEALTARHGAELRHLQAEHEALTAAQQVVAAPVAHPDDERAAQPPGDDAPPGATDVGRPGEPERPIVAIVPPPEPAPSLRGAIEAASQAAAALSNALADAARTLDDPARSPEPGRTPAPGHPAEPRRAPAEQAGHGERHDRPATTGAAAERTGALVARARARTRGGRRRPVGMPAGTIDETPLAAAFLVRLPQVLFLVDGYNVAKQGWPDLALWLQRERLVDALVDLQARTGAQTDVVFDGTDDAGLQARSAPGRLRIEFTASGVEADDRLLELVELSPLHRPVVVVSSDRRVRDGARVRGANTIGSHLLLGLLR
jgi:predicted RNA-binding protein with PIN domain